MLLFISFLSRYKSLSFPLLQHVEPTGLNCEKIAKDANLQEYSIGESKVRNTGRFQITSLVNRNTKSVMR